MDGGSISNKMDTPKRIRLSTFCSYRDNVCQSNEAQVYADYNNTSVASSTMVKPVIENVYIKSNIHFPISKFFDRPKPEPRPTVSESNTGLTAWKISGSSILQKAYQTKQLICLKVSEDGTHCIITKWGGEDGVAGVFQEKLIPFLQV